MAHKPDLFIAGQGIYLRALLDTDLDGPWYGWFNDAEVTAFQNKGFFPNTREKQALYLQGIRASSSDVVLAIVESATTAHIGNVGLHEINWIHRTAVLGIIIGEQRFQGKGYGSQAWRLITAYGFETLNLHKIVATMIRENERSLRCALRCGFEVEGEQKEQLYKNGRYHDLLLVGLTARRWFAQSAPTAMPSLP